MYNIKNVSLAILAICSIIGCRNSAQDVGLPSTIKTNKTESRTEHAARTLYEMLIADKKEGEPNFVDLYIRGKNFELPDADQSCNVRINASDKYNGAPGWDIEVEYATIDRRDNFLVLFEMPNRSAAIEVNLYPSHPIVKIFDVQEDAIVVETERDSSDVTKKFPKVSRLQLDLRSGTGSLLDRMQKVTIDETWTKPAMMGLFQKDVHFIRSCQVRGFDR